MGCSVNWMTCTSYSRTLKIPSSDPFSQRREMPNEWARALEWLSATHYSDSRQSAVSHFCPRLADVCGGDSIWSSVKNLFLVGGPNPQFLIDACCCAPAGSPGCRCY